jgi:hypothetical protein
MQYQKVLAHFYEQNDSRDKALQVYQLLASRWRMIPMPSTSSARMLRNRGSLPVPWRITAVLCV